MQSGEADLGAKAPRKKRSRHYSYDESVDEPAKLLEQEAVDIEAETPSEETEPVETVEPDGREGDELEE